MYRRDYLLDKFNLALSLKDYITASFYYKDMAYRNLLTDKEAKLFPSLLNGVSFKNTAYDNQFFEHFGSSTLNFSSYQEDHKIKGDSKFENEQDFISFTRPIIEFLANKKSLVKIDYSSPFVTKDDIIKSATEQDSRDSEHAGSIIDQVWVNKHYNALFTLLSIFIAEGKQFKFIFSKQLDMVSYSSHLQTNYSLDIFVHESYHALQNFIFNFKDYFHDNLPSNDLPDNKKEFFSAFCKTYINIIKTISSDIDLSTVNTNDYIALNQLLINLLPPKVFICDSLITSELVKNESLDTINAQNIQDLNDGKNFTDHNEFLTVVNNYCSMVDEKFAIPSDILERILYFATTGNIGNGYFTELMPVTFELMARNFDHTYFNLFEPIIEYFDKQIVPIIEYYKQLHIEYNCAPLLDEMNGQCLPIHYALTGLQCISDFIE